MRSAHCGQICCTYLLVHLSFLHHQHGMALRSQLLENLTEVLGHLKTPRGQCQNICINQIGKCHLSVKICSARHTQTHQVTRTPENTQRTMSNQLYQPDRKMSPFSQNLLSKTHTNTPSNLDNKTGPFLPLYPEKSPKYTDPVPP